MTRRSSIVVALVILWAVPARGQPVGDHLKCYKVSDPQPKASYSADLDGLVAETGCTIKVPAIMACVPSTKTNVTPEPPGGGGSGTPTVFGCYKVKCPKGTSVPTIVLHDQFGSRTVTPKAAKIVCAPSAVVQPPTTITPTTTTSCPPATAAYCGSASCGQGGFGACDPFLSPLCPQGMTCTSSGTTCGCTGAAIPCGDPRLSGLTCNFCKWGTCPPGMTCGGVPKNGACGYDCACQ